MISKEEYHICTKAKFFSFCFIFLGTFLIWYYFFILQFREDVPKKYISLDNINIPVTRSESNVLIVVHISSLKRLETLKATWFKDFEKKYSKVTIKTFSSIYSDTHVDFSVRGIVLDFRKLTKMWSWIRKISAKEEFDWYFKCDDDTFIFADSFMDKVRNLPFEDMPHYFGYPLYGGINYASGGAGYFINHAALNSLFMKPKDEENGIEEFRCFKPMFEDMCFGYWVNLFGVSIQDCFGLHPHHEYQMIEWMFGDSYDHVRPLEYSKISHDVISYHYVKPSKMISLAAINRHKGEVPKILHVPPSFSSEKCKLKYNYFKKREYIIRRYKHFDRDLPKMGEKLIRKYSEKKGNNIVSRFLFGFSMLYDEGGVVILESEGCEYLENTDEYIRKTMKEKKDIFIVLFNGKVVTIGGVKYSRASYAIIRDLHTIKDINDRDVSYEFLRKEGERLKNDFEERVKLIFVNGERNEIL